MKILLAVKTCVSDTLKGHNQVIRETYASSLPANVDLWFFLGNARPGPLELEHTNFQKDYRNLQNVKPQMIRPEPTALPLLFPDEIVLNAPDTYPYISHKQREMCRWMMKRDYDVMMRVDTDTFVHIRHLLDAGFQDYVGEGSDMSGGPPGYAFGGCGIWMSRQVCSLLQDAPITCLADDVWIADILKPQGIFVQHDKRFSYNLETANRHNVITVHLGGKTGTYNNKMMYQAYRMLL